MVDCSDTGTCSIPMWVQYVILAVAFLLFAIKACRRHDPFDRM